LIDAGPRNRLPADYVEIIDIEISA